MTISAPRRLILAIAAAAGLASAAPALAANLQCVPFARAASGVELFGNAHSWWDQAAGRYERGQRPAVGAVMAMAPTRAMPLGHVAVVAKVINDREILIDHANWSRINGRRGQVERGVRAVDVSAAGDWSAVRVWYASSGDLGLRSNPVRGFIYAPASRPAADAPRWAKADWQPGNGLAAIAADLTRSDPVAAR